MISWGGGFAGLARPRVPRNAAAWLSAEPARSVRRWSTLNVAMVTLRHAWIG